MNHTRIPMEDKYAAILGQAVYAFAYYEWTIIYIMEYIGNGFVGEYCRTRTLTSGNVNKEFQKYIVNYSGKVKIEEFQNCYQCFDELVNKCNALIHSHPITDYDGSQILNYQAKTTKVIHDVKWTKKEMEKLIMVIDSAENDAAILLDNLRNQ